MLPMLYGIIASGLLYVGCLFHTKRHEQFNRVSQEDLMNGISLFIISLAISTIPLYVVIFNNFLTLHPLCQAGIIISLTGCGFAMLLGGVMAISGLSNR